MCLYSKTDKPQIAKKPIKVFKVLQKEKRGYRTPFQGYKMKEGEHYYQTDEKFTIHTRDTTGNYKFYIDRGLHAFIKISRVKSLRSYFTERVVVEMEIPKGSEYFIGKNGDIVSDNLIWHWDAKIHKL